MKGPPHFILVRQPLLWSKWRDSNPRPFGPEFENVLVFPTLSANFRKLPVFSAFFRLFPPVSGNFETVLNWTFGISQVQPSAATGRVAPMKERVPLFLRKAPEENHIVVRIIKAHVDRARPKGQDLFIFPVNIIHRKCQTDILVPVVFYGPVVIDGQGCSFRDDKLMSLIIASVFHAQQLLIKTRKP